MISEIRDVLRSINEPFDCVLDGDTYKFDSGEMASEALNNTLKVSHSIKGIGTNNGRLYIEIADQQEQIDEANKVWMDAEKKRTGVDPSFF